MDLSGYLCETRFEAPPNLEKVTEIIGRAALRESGILQEWETYELFKLIGFNTPDFIYHKVGESLEELAKKLGTRKWVAKCDILGCLHKSDIGGVDVGVSASDCVARVGDMIKRLEKEGIAGVLLAEMCAFHTGGPTNGELLMSTLTDAAFGPCICFGFGGTTVEYLKDIMRPSNSVVFFPTPIDPRSTSFRRMLTRTPACQYLTGEVRGVRKQTDVETIIDSLAALHRVQHYFSAANPDAPYIIDELEINPCVIPKADPRPTALDGVLRAHVNPHKGKGYPLYTTPKDLGKVNALVKPKSAIIMGASTTQQNGAATVVLRMLADGGIPDKTQVYAVHPKATDILGVRAFPTVDAVIEARGGEPVDLFVCGVRASIAEKAMIDVMTKKQANSIFVLSAGFGETQAGKEGERRLREAHAALDPKERCVINGPNTLGNYCEDGCNTSFIPPRKSSRCYKGPRNAALVCQSGACMISRLSDMGRTLNPHFAASVGNQLDLTATDLIDFLIHDPEMRKKTDVIGLYAEGLADNEGPRMMHLVTEAREMGVLVVIYKAGRSKQGRHAAQGHTASMAGDYDMFAYLLENAGAVVVRSFEEMENGVMIGACQPKLVESLRKIERGKKVVVGAVTNAGFEKCAIGDHLFGEPQNDRFMSLPDMTGHRLEVMQKVFDEAHLSEVMDVDPIIDTTPLLKEEYYVKICQILFEYADCDMTFLSPLPETAAVQTMDNEVFEDGDDIRGPTSVIQQALDLRRTLTDDKTLFMCLDSGYKFQPAAEYLTHNGLATFRRADEGMRIIARVIRAIRSDMTE